MVAGDSVSFAAANGNHVLITYSPRSNFGADFCAGGSAVAKNIPMRFTGPQDVVDFAMSSFVVGAPAAECSKVSRRVADLAATIVSAADVEPRRRRRISNGRACGMCIAFLRSFAVLRRLRMTRRAAACRARHVSSRSAATTDTVRL
jgi:hypothetical protein